MSNAQIFQQRQAQIQGTYAFYPVSINLFYKTRKAKRALTLEQKIGLLLLIFSFGAIIAALLPYLRLEFNQYDFKGLFGKPLPSPSLQPELNPLVAPDGTQIAPINREFSLIIPTIGVNAPIIPGVNPVQENGYNKALLNGVAHSSTSFYPNQNGTVYLFSHSTNYEWFVKDLNAVFYLIKKLKADDYIVIFYLNNRYTYKMREQKIIGSREISYLQPQKGTRNLILQTCWPPGTAYQRLLIFADFVEEKIYQQFGDVR